MGNRARRRGATQQGRRRPGAERRCRGHERRTGGGDAPKRSNARNRRRGGAREPGRAAKASGAGNRGRGRRGDATTPRRGRRARYGDATDPRQWSAWKRRGQPPRRQAAAKMADHRREEHNATGRVGSQFSAPQGATPVTPVAQWGGHAGGHAGRANRRRAPAHGALSAIFPPFPTCLAASIAQKRTFANRLL